MTNSKKSLKKDTNDVEKTFYNLLFKGYWKITVAQIDTETNKAILSTVHQLSIWQDQRDKAMKPTKYEIGCLKEWKPEKIIFKNIQGSKSKLNNREFNLIGIDDAITIYSKKQLINNADTIVWEEFFRSVLCLDLPDYFTKQQLKYDLHSKKKIAKRVDDFYKRENLSEEEKEDIRKDIQWLLDKPWWLS